MKKLIGFQTISWRNFRFLGLFSSLKRWFLGRYQLLFTAEDTVPFWGRFPRTAVSFQAASGGSQGESSLGFRFIPTRNTMVGELRKDKSLKKCTNSLVAPRFNVFNTKIAKNIFKINSSLYH